MKPGSKSNIEASAEEAWLTDLNGCVQDRRNYDCMLSAQAHYFCQFIYFLHPFLFTLTDQFIWYNLTRTELDPFFAFRTALTVFSIYLTKC